MRDHLVRKGCVAATSALLWSLASSLQAAVVTPGPSLPPANGLYVDSSLEYSGYQFTIVLSELVLRDFTGVIQTNVGADELQVFDAKLSGHVDATLPGSGGVTGAVEFIGPVEMLAHDKADTTTGAFPIEVVAVSLSGDVGGIPAIIRESPARASSGTTVIADIGSGLFEIESFFDLFTEISIDGGETWVAASGSSRFELQPVPLPPAWTMLIAALVSLRAARPKLQPT